MVAAVRSTTRRWKPTEALAEALNPEATRLLIEAGADLDAGSASRIATRRHPGASGCAERWRSSDSPRLAGPVLRVVKSITCAAFRGFGVRDFVIGANLVTLSLDSQDSRCFGGLTGGVAGETGGAARALSGFGGGYRRSLSLGGGFLSRPRGGES